MFDTVKAKYGDELTAERRGRREGRQRLLGELREDRQPEWRRLTTWPVYKAQTDAILDFTNQGPKAGPDAWKARMDVTEAAAQGH